MTETSENEQEPDSSAEEGNPTDAELDVEGPNESGPGHHPAGDEDEEAPASSPPSP